MVCGARCSSLSRIWGRSRTCSSAASARPKSARKRLRLSPMHTLRLLYTMSYAYLLWTSFAYLLCTPYACLLWISYIYLLCSSYTPYALRPSHTVAIPPDSLTCLFPAYFFSSASFFPLFSFFLFFPFFPVFFFSPEQVLPKADAVSR